MECPRGHRQERDNGNGGEQKESESSKAGHANQFNRYAAIHQKRFCVKGGDLDGLYLTLREAECMVLMIAGRTIREAVQALPPRSCFQPDRIQRRRGLRLPACGPAE